MNRLCKVGDIIQSNQFRHVEPREGVYYLGDLLNQNTCGNDFLVVKVETIPVTKDNYGEDWPGTHYVVAQMISDSKHLELYEYKLGFYQSGCYNHILKPKDIRLIGEAELKQSFQRIK